MRSMLLLLTAVLLVASLSPARADTTVSATNRFAYGTNIGWVDWYADGTNGARIGEFFCSGYLYSANCGWISLGLCIRAVIPSQ